jgi:hypothetical protein
MCTDESPAGQFPAVLHDFEPAVEIVLEPVDSVVVTTLMDNVTDTTMPDQGPAQHATSARFPAAFVPSTVGTSFHL